jgi:UDP-N-acetylmuramate--alanine ligase
MMEKLPDNAHIHLVGIGGSGISAIAWALMGRGYRISGSDQRTNKTTAALAAEGATVYHGHAPEHINGADVLVVSSAVPANNPEVEAAKARGVPVMKRADFLGYMMTDKIGIAVAGSHGKTTTTGMIAQILLTAELDPTVILGGELAALGRNGRAGHGPHFVIEADEYDHMFLGLKPQLAVVTNVEYDHPDLFTTPEAYQDAFRSFVKLLPQDGRLFLCTDDPGAVSLAETIGRDGPVVEQYGLGSGDWQALDMRVNQLGGVDFLVEHRGETMGLARLRVPGDHNVRNALAAIAVTVELGVPLSAIWRSLAAFGGVGRRFQITGRVGDVTIIDDYAHHPTEIRATLAAARQQFPGRRLWAVWQPHTYSRTKKMQAEFAASFDQADRVIALNIYRSREQDTLGISSADVVAMMSHSGAKHIGEMADAAAYLLDRVQPGDVILTLGAGDGYQVGQWLLADLQKRISV